jgi:hypothetical protein
MTCLAQESRVTRCNGHRAGGGGDVLVHGLQDAQNGGADDWK